MFLFFILSIILLFLLSTLGKYLSVKLITKIDKSDKSSKEKLFYLRLILFVFIVYGFSLLFVGPLLIELGKYVLK